MAIELIRKEGWEIALSQFLHARRKARFVWGENDCVLFPADAVQAITGVDPAAAGRGYKTEAEANAILAGLGTLDNLITSGMGFPPHTNARMAKRGDVVIMEINGQKTGGIVDDSGQKLVCVTLKNGLMRLPLSRATRVWSY